MRRVSLLRRAAIAVATVIVGACAREPEPPPPDSGAMHDMSAMHADPAMMQRHADEADAFAARMRAHLSGMRGLAADQWRERMPEHTGMVAEMLSLMNRHMREMDMGMGMDDEQMGAMIGMSGAEHRRMLDEMQALRQETEELQTAPPAAVRGRMSQHLDRVERLVAALEQSAAHMRGDHAAGHDLQR
jgi:hypothetical protein